MASERSKRCDLLALSFITKSIPKKLLINYYVFAQRSTSGFTLCFSHVNAISVNFSQVSLKVYAEFVYAAKVGNLVFIRHLFVACRN